jgi:hypothetical protein
MTHQSVWEKHLLSRRQVDNDFTFLQNYALAKATQAAQAQLSVGVRVAVRGNSIESSRFIRGGQG